MKNNQGLILEDIKRNLELMGIETSTDFMESFFEKKELIKESTILKKAFINIFDALKPAEQKISNSVKKYLIGGIEVDNAFYNSFKRLKEDFDVNWPRFISNPGYTSRLADILRQNSEIIKVFYDDLMTDIILKVPGVRSERNFYKLLKKKEDAILAHNKANPSNQLPPFNLNDELGGAITDPLEREVLFPTFKKNYDQYKKGDFKSTVYPKKNVDDITLSNRQIANFKKVVSTSSRYWNNISQAWTKNLDELRLDIEGLSKGYLQSIKNTSDPEQLKDIANAYSVQISNKLSLMEAKMKGSAIELLEEEGIPDDIIKILRNDQNTFYKLFRESLQKGSGSVDEYVDLITESIQRNFKEITTFLRNLFSRNFFDAVKHLINPRTDLGTWFYTNQWAGLNKLFHLAVKNGAFESKKAFFTKFLPKVMIATNIGYLTGWLIKSGLVTIFEEVLKPFYNVSFGNLFCGIMILVKNKDVDCDDYKFDIDKTKSIERAFISRMIDESWAVMSEQYSKKPITSTVSRLTPIFNYAETYRHSMFIKFLEGITGRKIFLNLVGSSPEDATEEIKTNVGPEADSININWDDLPSGDNPSQTGK